MKVIVCRDVIFNEADFRCSASTECESHLNTFEVDSLVGTEDGEQVDEVRTRTTRKSKAFQKKKSTTNQLRNRRMCRFSNNFRDLWSTTCSMFYTADNRTYPKCMEETLKNDHTKE